MEDRYKVSASNSCGSEKKINYDVVNKELFEKWRATGREEYYQKIIITNARLCYYQASKFSNTGYDIDDLTAEGVIGLIKAVNTFDITKEIKFVTYASRCIENEMLMYMRRNKKNKDVLSMEGSICYDSDGHELKFADILGTDDDEVINAAINGVLDNGIDDEIERTMDICSLSVIEKRILNLRFGLGEREPLTQKETSVVVGYSQSYISRVEKRAKTKILKSNKHHLRDYYHG